jgi:hypothetical protein
VNGLFSGGNFGWLLLIIIVVWALFGSHRQSPR